MAEFDARSERLIATLLPKVQPWAREFLRRARATGVDARIISGTRTYAEQNALYAQGRTKPGPKVTNARGGFSNHNFGIAWDIGVFRGGTYLGSSKLYNELGPVGRAMGLEWGGDWKTFKDTPHYQIKTGLSLSELRAIVARGGEVPIPPLGGGAAADPPVSSPPATPPSEPALDTHGVKVLLDGKSTEIPALLLESRCWVGVRAFCEAVGGTVVKASGSPLSIKIAINGESLQLKGKSIGGVGFAKFADINALLGYGFVFDANHRELRLTSKP